MHAFGNSQLKREVRNVHRESEPVTVIHHFYYAFLFVIFFKCFFDSFFKDFKTFVCNLMLTPKLTARFLTCA